MSKFKHLSDDWGADWQFGEHPGNERKLALELVDDVCGKLQDDLFALREKWESTSDEFLRNEVIGAVDWTIENFDFFLEGRDIVICVDCSEVRRVGLEDVLRSFMRTSNPDCITGFLEILKNACRECEKELAVANERSSKNSA